MGDIYSTQLVPLLYIEACRFVTWNMSSFSFSRFFLYCLFCVYTILWTKQNEWCTEEEQCIPQCVLSSRGFTSTLIFFLFFFIFIFIYFFFTVEGIFVGFCNNGFVTKFNKFHLSPHLSHLWCHIQNTYTIFNWIFIESCDCFTMFERGNILLANWICLVISGIVLFIHFFYFYFWYFS